MPIFLTNFYHLKGVSAYFFIVVLITSCNIVYGQDSTILLDSSTIEVGTSEDIFFSAGFAAHLGSDRDGQRGSAFGYYLGFLYAKTISSNLFVSSGIDGYSVPYTGKRLIGQINMNLGYRTKFGSKIDLFISTGFFTGFIQRRDSGGFTSGFLLSSIFRFNMSKLYSMGVMVKYPFFTEAPNILLGGAFFGF